jgi:rRNA maturation endonuclease Nob1
MNRFTIPRDIYFGENDLDVLKMNREASHRKVCERCLAITAHDQCKCPRCGYTRLSEIMITVQDGKNKDFSKAGVG